MKRLMLAMLTASLMLMSAPAQAASDSPVGKWAAKGSAPAHTITVRANGTFRLVTAGAGGPVHGTWQFCGQRVCMNYAEMLYARVRGDVMVVQDGSSNDHYRFGKVG